jgi:hypothetical protein
MPHPTAPGRLPGTHERPDHMDRESRSERPNESRSVYLMAPIAIPTITDVIPFSEFPPERAKKGRPSTWGPLVQQIVDLSRGGQAAVLEIRREQYPRIRSALHIALKRKGWKAVMRTSVGKGEDDFHLFVRVTAALSEGQSDA